MISENKAKLALVKIAEMLIKEGSISKKQVVLETGIWGVAQRICDLRNSIGFNIATDEIKGDCIYHLIKAPRDYLERIAQHRQEIKTRRKALNNI